MRAQGVGREGELERGTLIEVTLPSETSTSRLQIHPSVTDTRLPWAVRQKRFVLIEGHPPVVNTTIIEVAHCPSTFDLWAVLRLDQSKSTNQHKQLVLLTADLHITPRQNHVRHTQQTQSALMHPLPAIGVPTTMCINPWLPKQNPNNFVRIKYLRIYMRAMSISAMRRTTMQHVIFMKQTLDLDALKKTKVGKVRVASQEI